MKCNKVPKLVELEQYNGSYSEYEDEVYNIYNETLGELLDENKLYWEGKKIVQKKHPIYKNRPGTFWHIISSGKDEASREPDLRRYERIAWPGFILNYCKENCKNILVWKNKRKTSNRVLIWCRDIEYLVVLDERKEFYIFWTAYPIEHSHTKEKLMREYKEYIKIKQKALE